MDITFLTNLLAARPQAEPVDAVKLLYQQEFGCGHLLPHEAVCAAGVRREVEQTVADGAQPAFEPIGNGLCRLQLRHPDVRALPPERIARMMAVTDGAVHGSQAHFSDSIQLLRKVAGAKNSGLPFDGAALEAYLAGDWAANLPPSHSEGYRAAYHPAYRVVLRRFGEALPLIAAMEKRLQTQGRATLVMDGDCASGKTTLTALLAPLYECNVLHMDDFFLPFAMRTPARMAEAGGNVHYERFQAQVLQGLLSGEPFAYEAYDCHRDRSRTVKVLPKPVTLIEGSYSLHPTFDSAYEALGAVRALLSVSGGEQLRRIRLRNGKVMLTRFRDEWIPLEKSYFEAYHKARDGEITLVSERHPEDE